MDMQEMEKKAKEQTQKALDTSPEMQKLLEEQRKLKQKEERLKDKMIKLKKKETEKARKARSHRLIKLGAIIESELGIELPDGSDELEAIVRCYLPIIREERKSGRFAERLKKVREEDETKKKAAEAAKANQE